MSVMNEPQTFPVALPLISFPSTEDPDEPLPELSSNARRPPHLPFRRISLPSSASGLNVNQNRMSIVSNFSFEYTPEEGLSSSAELPPSPSSPKNSPRKVKGRPTSLMAGVGASSGQRRAPSRRRESDLPYVEVDLAREMKRANVVREIHETERAYLDGLELIYSLFLTPLVESLETPQPLVNRSELTSIFSNFIDIWNLHRAFYESLTELLAGQSPPPPLSKVLGSHFPYLSLYNPFITAFPNVLSSLSNLSMSSPAFAQWLSKQEANPRCKKLPLRAWLLTIVQRCPRYLLLLKDLMDRTDAEDPEYAALSTINILLAKITQSLDTALQTHAQVLSLLAIQRSTPNLPFPLLTPGRKLLKRGALLQVDRDERLREFFLFSDCLMWLSRGGEREWGSGITRNDVQKRPPMRPRTRSKSDAELPTFRALNLPLDGEERWWYRGQAQLVDIDVITSPVPPPGEESRFDLLSPESSFTLYAATRAERDEWTAAIRNAKAAQLASLSMMNPDSTLTSSSSTTHLRRALQALPHDPEEPEARERRGKVDHFVPAIWVPDGKTQSCMRCSRNFNWRRRRHHCRLCGRCVCSDCSERTFHISDPNSKGPTKPARACNACYETVFPVISAQEPLGYSIGTLSAPPSHASMSMPSLALPSITTPAGGSSYRQWEDRSVPPSSFLRQSGPRPHSFSRLSTGTISTVQSEAVGESTLDLLGTPPTSTSFPSLPATPDPDRKAKRKTNRFSLPAVSVQTTPVTTHVAAEGEGRTRRFSLVLGGKSQFQKKKDQERERNKSSLDKGIAANKLSDILGRVKAT